MLQTNMCNARAEESGCRGSIAGLFALLALAAILPRAHGQTAQPPVSPAPSQFVTAEEVSLDVVVHDKKNRPVLDLKPGEIAVTDNGSPVKLNSLRLVSGKPDSDRLITLVFDRPNPNVKLTAGDVADSDAKAALANRSSFSDQSLMKTARDAAAKILKMIPESGFSFAVADVEQRLRVEQRFTSDRKVIVQAIKVATEPSNSVGANSFNEPERELIAMARTGADSSGKAISGRDRAEAESLTAALADTGRIAQDQHLRAPLAVLLALAQSQQQLAQRKVIIYFTFSADMKLDSHEEKSIPSILGAANRAGVSLYIVDLNSLDPRGTRQDAADSGRAAFAMALDIGPNQTFGSAIGMAGQSSLAGNPQSLRVMGDMHEEVDNHGPFQLLAEGTGGGYINRDHLRKPLEQMVQDMTTYYEASYVPPIEEYDGKFRPVAVKPLRKGLRIRTQTGYLALPQHSGDGGAPQAFELPLLKILSATPLPAVQAFHAAILRMGDSPDGNVNTVAIEAPLSSLEVKEDTSTNLYSAHVSMLAVIKDNTGAVIERFGEDIPRRGALRNLDEATSDAITLQRHFVAPPGQYVLEAAVVDNNSGKAGAQRIPFEIPAGTGALSLSDVVLVRRTELARPEDDPTEPLVHGGDKVTPNLSGQLPSGANKVTLFFIACTDPHGTGAVTLKIKVFRGGQQLAEAPLAAPLSSESAYLSSFTLNPPMDGAYEVKVILSRGGKTTEAKAGFTLTGVQPSNLYAVAASSEASVPEVAPPPPGPLVITFPANSVERPAPEELKSILADAARFAEHYSNSLPNFMCEQVTDRLVDWGSERKWRQKDKITERLVYVDHNETRNLLEFERNGLKTHDNSGQDYGVLSYGEFGSALKGIFQPLSKADFQWKQSGLLGDGKVQVFDYRVARGNSTFYLGLNAEGMNVGFHGQVFIDSATRSVRRFTEIADNLPERFPIRAAAVSVDYEYVLIDQHDCLVPVGAQVILKKGHWETNLNQIEFRNFRRYGSDAKILDFSPNAKP